MSLQMFIPITKVDVPNRLVYGLATAEKLDRAGEICDYAGTKPLYEKWSGSIFKASGGKSMGNLRSMHAKIAAGKLTAINFDDDAKAIEICAKVVDQAEWEKVLEGVYTGFSQGGNYAKRWRDNTGAQRYIAEPTEISLVDLPCLDIATFDVIKANGVIEKAHFKSGTIKDPALLPMLALEGDPLPVYKDHAGGEHATLELAKVANSKIEADALAAAAAANPLLAKINSNLDRLLGSTAFTPVAEPVVPHQPVAAPVAKAAAASDDDKDPKKPFGDVDYADTGFQDDKKHRYPIDTAAHIKSAWSYINQKKNADLYSAADLKTVKDRIVAAWKDKIDKDGPPSATEKSWIAGELSKGLYTVGRLACLLEELVWLQESVQNEAAWEADNSTLPASLKASIASLVVDLRAMVIEETNELFTPLDIDALPAETVILLEMAYGITPTAQRKGIVKFMSGVETLKAATAAMLKVGARHNAADMDRIQKMHDTACELGANCGGDPANEGDPVATPDPGGEGKNTSTGTVAKNANRAQLFKALGEREAEIADLKKRIGEQAGEHEATLTAISKRIEELEKMPMPTKGVVFAVSKEQDGDGFVPSATGADGKPVKKTLKQLAAEIPDPAARARFLLSNGAYHPPGL